MTARDRQTPEPGPGMPREIDTADARRPRWRAAAVRAAFFLGLWVVLMGPGAFDLLAGVPAAALATAASLRLLPPEPLRLDAAALVSLGLRFLRQSIVAGVDVAFRALDPRLPLRPGFVTYPVRASPGMFRSAFAAFTSLQPGTVPAGSSDGGLVYHCLDTDQPVASQLAAEEAALARVVRHD